MKRKINKIIAVILLTGIFTSCSLDEFNPSTVDLEISYKNKPGFDGLVNSCYLDLYYLYGKIDGIGAMEAGTDLWTNSGNSETGFILYNTNLNTSLGTLKVLWQSLYTTINLANTAIYYAPEVQGYDNEEVKNAKVAEAYFMRGWANFHLVEQFGNVVLRDQPSVVVTGNENLPERSSEEAFYDLIISDLQFAAANLPVSQAEIGRVSQKAAYAMLAKVALQRTRLGEKEKYAKIALDAAEELINNQQTYGAALYQSDAEQSGFAKLWAGENNKNNSEFLFVENIDHEGALNPEGWNRGRTRQYYETDLKTVGAAWGMTEKSLIYGRANSRAFKPTKYLLTEIFEPSATTPDTRFENTFFHKYYAYKEISISADLANQAGKDPSLIGHVIKSSIAKGSEPDVKAANYYASIEWKDGASFEGFRNLENDESLAIFTPNWTIPAAEKAQMPYMVNDPSDMYQESGKWTENGQRKEIYPSLRKFSNVMYAYTEQYHMMNFPILRLGETYLVAAEAALLYNGDQDKAAEYVNTIRKRAAVLDQQDDMVVTADKMTVDFILAERARELTGEQVRWYDLKRTGKLTNSYLGSTNPEITEFDEKKHFVRPIPVSFLNAISNPNEFGTNGY